MIAAARRALVLEVVQWPPPAQTVGVSDGLYRLQPVIVRGLQKADQMPRIAIPKREDAPAESKPILDKVDKMLASCLTCTASCRSARTRSPAGLP